MSNTQSRETKHIHHRGKNFSGDDDRNICIAWLTISCDPLKGRDQQGDAFWKEVQEHAKMKKRSWNAVRQRWGQISRCVMKFIECYSAVSNRTTDSLQEDSVYEEAVKLYLATTKSKKWQFSECWEMLRNNPKFNHFHELRISTIATAGPTTIVPQHFSNNESETCDNESNADGTAMFDDFNSTSEISMAYNAENNIRPSNDYPPDQQDIERRRVEALEMLAKASRRKNELLAEYVGAIKAATDAKYVTMSTQNLDNLSLQILNLKKTEILMKIKNAQAKS